MQNKQLRTTINYKGAEPISLIDVKTNTEYLWQANPAFWASHAPILFPIIGSLKDEEYVYEGKNYSLPQHGFAKDMEFALLSQNDSAASFSLKSNEQTVSVYPFRFELVVSYALVGRSLNVKYQVFNQDDKEIYFSIGGHPGFNCPLKAGEKRSDYQLVFAKREQANIHLKTGKLRSGETVPFLENENTIEITDSLFDDGPLIFSTLQSGSVQLKKGDKRILAFHFEGFPNLGIWSRSKTSPFICIEPWFGMTDPVYTNQKIEEKEGIVRLKAGEEFACQYTIEL
ncbi:MAG: aldose 1-epimerase family protein [Saprospiraceae bacterium]